MVRKLISCPSHGFVVIKNTEMWPSKTFDTTCINAISMLKSWFGKKSCLRSDTTVWVLQMFRFDSYCAADGLNLWGFMAGMLIYWQWQLSWCMKCAWWLGVTMVHSCTSPQCALNTTYLFDGHSLWNTFLVFKCLRSACVFKCLQGNALVAELVWSSFLDMLMGKSLFRAKGTNFLTGFSSPTLFKAFQDN